jgi:hypothetical protein
LFERRAERHWYAADVDEHPQAVDFDSWQVSPGSPALPGEFETWSAFWDGVDAPSAHPATNRRER